MADRNCTIEGCGRRHDSHGLCAMHHRRWLVHGDTGPAGSSRRPSGTGHTRSDGYVSVGCKGHPLATGRGYGYMHRIVLYDVIGPGPHACHWCGTLADWLDSDPGLTADHMDWDKSNNTPENLVPACLACNSKRYAERTDRGSANPMAKLTEADVRAIRQATGMHKEIAARYNVSDSLVSMIKRRVIWAWLAGAA